MKNMTKLSCNFKYKMLIVIMHLLLSTSFTNVNAWTEVPLVSVAAMFCYRRNVALNVFGLVFSNSVSFVSAKQNHWRIAEENK